MRLCFLIPMLFFVISQIMFIAATQHNMLGSWAPTYAENIDDGIDK